PPKPDSLFDGFKLNPLPPKKIDPGQWPQSSAHSREQRLIQVKKTRVFEAKNGRVGAEVWS
ncbi:hypothetical protein, partial [Klebsiella pneumoniae]|uniref:hypothetical protein n=1 Tax=Klebsiella pneumoniae TaxID=573 RepID=UPI00210A70C8